MMIYTIKNRAFSLIELMVVIAIVAVLAAIAMPAYKNYLTKTKATNVLSVIDNLSKKSILYSQEHGVFANAYNLGLSTTVDSEVVDNPSEFFTAEYIQGVIYPVLEIADRSNVTPCGAVGVINTIVNAHALGIPGAIAGGDSLVAFSHAVYHIDGIFKTYKYYYIYIDGNPGYLPGDYIAGWDNMVIDDGATMNPVVEANSIEASLAECQ